MATLNISYWSGLENGLPWGPISCQSLTTSGTSAQGATIPPEARVATFHCADAAHAVTLGSDPTAVNGAGGFIVPAAYLMPYSLLLNAPGNKFAAITI